MKDMFRELYWQNHSHLRFADDITLIASDQDKLQNIIEELNEKFHQNLKLNQ